MSDNLKDYLPLTESTFYILLALSEPLHGYGVMQKVKIISEETVKVGPGTLYGAFGTLEKEGVIVKVGEQNRRKSYRITDKGKELLREHVRRLEVQLRCGQNVIENWRS